MPRRLVPTEAAFAGSMSIAGLRRSMGHSIGRLSVMIGCLALAAGCGSNLPAVAPVKGTITWRGQPVAGATVMFMPGNGRPATGMTDAEGHFHLSTFGQADGALPGHHKVSITKRVAIGDGPYPPERSEIPPNYANTTTSGLEVDVTAAGPNDFPFELVGEAK
jgi:hypothetical protein